MLYGDKPDNTYVNLIMEVSDMEVKEKLDTELALTSIEHHVDTIRNTNKQLTAVMMDLTTEDGLSYGVINGDVQHLLESIMTLLDKFETMDLMVFRHELDKLVFSRSIPEKEQKND
jgi:hypothetical protein